MSERVYRIERVGCWIGQISAERSDAVMKAEVADHVHGVFPLPMGIEREDRCSASNLAFKDKICLWARMAWVSFDTAFNRTHARARPHASSAVACSCMIVLDRDRCIIVCDIFWSSRRL